MNLLNGLDSCLIEGRRDHCDMDNFFAVDLYALPEHLGADSEQAGQAELFRAHQQWRSKYQL